MVTTSLLVLVLCKFAVSEVPWECRGDDHYKPEPAAHITGVENDRDMYELADRKVMPNVSDLKGRGISSVVVIKILVATDGSVRCARIQSADPQLAQRSLDAARKWHYRADLLKLNMVNVETTIVFDYDSDRVKSIPPLPRHL